MTQPPPASPDSSPHEAQLIVILNLKDVVTRTFPSLWRPTEVLLSAVATLLLVDVTDPAAIILVGRPAGAKTTLLNFFEPALWLIYWSDRFTPKAFVSHHAGASSKKLEKVDLLPRIKLRVLVTLELAPMFRGRIDDLTEYFATLTRVLDGQGLMVDSGVHGQRGYTGDYYFVWLGATTPLPRVAWELMAQLGSRLFFYPMDDTDPTTEELEEGIRGDTPYKEKVEECREATTALLNTLLPNADAIRSIEWDRAGVPLELATQIGTLARVLAALRGVVPREGNSSRVLQFGPPLIEQPWRAQSVLFNLARGHALLYGRTHLTPSDVAMLIPIALGSCPDYRRKIFRRLIEAGRSKAQLTASMVASEIDVTKEPARDYLHEMERLGLVQVTTLGQTEVFDLDPKWSWFVSQEFKELEDTDTSLAL